MSSSSAVAFETKSISKTFGSGRAGVLALSGVDLRIRAGEFVVVAGPSGSGKSTLLNLLAGFDRPDHGRVVVSGKDMTDLGETEWTALRRHDLGFVFQAFNLIPVLSAYENVEYGLWLNGVSRSERRQRVTEILTTVGLADRMSQRPDHLSGGERQRVALARSLVHQPLAVLADEPTASLDSQTAADILRLFIQLNESQQTTFVFATHDTAIISRAPRVVRLGDGRIIADTGADRL